MEKLEKIKIKTENWIFWNFRDLQDIFLSDFDLEIQNEYIETIKFHCIKNWLSHDLHCAEVETNTILSKQSCYVLVDKLNILNRDLKKQLKDYFYHKDFEGWNKEKQRIDEIKREKFINSREIWDCKLWINVWNESNGKWKYSRPVLVISRVWWVYFVVPLTKNWKNEWEKTSEYYYKLQDDIFEFDSYVMLSQIKTLDKNRFVKKIWKMTTNDFKEIKNRLKEMYFPND